MLTLIEKWRNEAASDEKILKDLLFLINATRNGLNLFTAETVDETRQIKYCIPCSDDVDTYGKTTGICYSESAAHDAIRETFNSHAVLLLSWIMQGENDLNFSFKLSNPISYVVEENGAQKEIFDVMIVFSKCQNKVGFCVKSVIPVLGNKKEDYE